MDLFVGKKATRTLTLNADHVQTFADLTGDYNPLHFDESFTGKTKFKRLVVQGGLTTGLLHALVDKDMPVIAVAPNDELLGKLISNIEEVSARGGELIVIADERAGTSLASHHGEVIKLATGGRLLSPAVLTIPLQLLAYHVGLRKGTDVDQPRNLAKSVTVE